jgi:hypothetical protein
MWNGFHPQIFGQNIFILDDKRVCFKVLSEQTKAKIDHDFEYRMIAKNGEKLYGLET